MRVTKGATTTVALAPPASETVLSGRVLVEGTTQGADGVLVTLLRRDPEGYLVQDTTRARPDGSYAFVGVELDTTYTIRVQDDMDGAIETRWYGDAATQATARPFGFTGGTRWTLSTIHVPEVVVAPTGRTVHGRVLDDAGAGIVHGEVVVRHLGQDDGVRRTSTDRLGRFSLDVSDPETYEVRVEGSGAWGPSTRRTVTVGDGPADAGVLRVPRYATVSGTITAPATFRGEAVETFVVAYDLAGRPVGTASGSRYRLTLPAGSYRLFLGGRNEAGQQLVSAWFGGRDAASATVVTVGAGGFARASGAVTDALAATSAPVVTGRAQVGSPLSASTGGWNITTDTRFAYQWYAGGTAVKGATGRTFTPTAAQAGKAVTVRVGATSTEGYAPAQAVSRAVTVKAVSRLTVKTSVAQRRATLAVAVSSPGSTPSGTVLVKQGARSVGKVALRNGAGRVTLKVARGTTRLTLTYAGSAITTAAATTVTLTAR